MKMMIGGHSLETPTFIIDDLGKSPKTDEDVGSTIVTAKCPRCGKGFEAMPMSAMKPILEKHVCSSSLSADENVIVPGIKKGDKFKKEFEEAYGKEKMKTLRMCPDPDCCRVFNTEEYHQIKCPKCGLIFTDLKRLWTAHAEELAKIKE